MKLVEHIDHPATQISVYDIARSITIDDVRGYPEFDIEDDWVTRGWSPVTESEHEILLRLISYEFNKLDSTLNGSSRSFGLMNEYGSSNEDLLVSYVSRDSLSSKESILWVHAYISNIDDTSILEINNMIR